ncbi:MAG: hypothetical protein IT363_16275 [Methanoregulaceae archaeon]|jgi:hypothetical protein|nr:hypothetical protein [Methanoregulaceae archaeon]
MSEQEETSPAEFERKLQYWVDYYNGPHCVGTAGTEKEYKLWTMPRPDIHRDAEGMLPPSARAANATAALEKFWDLVHEMQLSMDAGES